jgi:hypothetical protein
MSNINNQEKKITNIINYEISGFAYFEDRRFERTFCERYVFIKKSYLTSHFPTQRLIFIHYTPKDIPLSLTEDIRESFLPILELKMLLSNANYNSILLELLAKANSFDQVNIIFEYLIEHKKYDSETINAILDLSLNSRTIRGSFEAQKLILTLVYENINLIESKLVHKILSEFPHGHNLLIKENQDKHQELVGEIENAVKEKVKKSEHLVSQELKRNIQSTYQNTNRNLEIEAGEEELRKWDQEDSSWRIANDLD